MVAARFEIDRAIANAIIELRAILLRLEENPPAFLQSAGGLIAFTRARAARLGAVY